MAYAASKTREQFPLSRKKILKKTFGSALVLAILFFFLWLVPLASLFTSSSAGMFSISTFLLILIWLVLVVSLYLYQKWYFDVYFYDAVDDYIIIRKGPITPHEITIPYERIQDIYVDQDIFDRMFGIYDVHLSSATISSGVQAHIDGLEKQAADGLRDVLLQTVSKRISKKQ